MNNSQFDQEMNQENTMDRRLPYQTPQLIQVMMLEEKSVLGGCKGNAVTTGSGGVLGCVNFGTPCLSINATAS